MKKRNWIISGDTVFILMLLVIAGYYIITSLPSLLLSIPLMVALSTFLVFGVLLDIRIYKWNKRKNKKDQK